MGQIKEVVNQQFIESIKNRISNNLSPIDEIADLLNLNYDAAYRRLNGKVSFSLDEAVQIAKKFDISLNELFTLGSTDSYVVTQSKSIINMNDINSYLENIYEEMKFLANRDDASVLFAAREFPMFYFFLDPILIKFKLYSWFYIQNIIPIKKRISFEHFTPTDSLINNAKKVGTLYNSINLTEIWSFGALNNVLQQLIYFFSIRQISYEEVESICMALTHKLKELEEYTSNNHANPRKYQLYNNDVMMNNNAMVLNYKGLKKFAYPYTLLKFFTITDQKACTEQESYLINQLQYCTNITHTNIKEHSAFFNHKYDKISQCISVIRNKNNAPLFL